jgi:hypothetical protein
MTPFQAVSSIAPVLLFAGCGLSLNIPVISPRQESPREHGKKKSGRSSNRLYRLQELVSRFSSLPRRVRMALGYRFHVDRDTHVQK